MLSYIFVKIINATLELEPHAIIWALNKKKLSTFNIGEWLYMIVMDHNTLAFKQYIHHIVAM